MVINECPKRMPHAGTALDKTMRIRHLCIIPAAIAAWWISFAGWSEETGVPAKAPGVEIPDKLTLHDARQIAFELNWDLLAAKSSIDLADAQKIIAREYPNPSFSWGTAKVNIDGRTNSVEKGSNGVSPFAVPTQRMNGLWERSYDTTIAVSQLIELGGKRRLRAASADAGVEAAEAQFRDAKRILDNGVIKAYAAVLLAESNAAILRNSAGSMRKEAQLAAIREKAGEISATDRTQIEVAAGRFESDAAAALAAAETARVSLLTLVGSPQPKAEWTAADALEALAAAPAPAPPEQECQRPDLVAARAALKKAEFDLQGQQKLWIPDPTISLGYEHQPPDAPNTIGVGVSLPLPVWHKYKGEVQAAMVARNDALRTIQKVRAAIIADQNQARIAYSDASQRWQRYKTEVQPKSAQVKENISFAYQKGGATILDLLSAQRADNDTRLATVQAAADTLNALADIAAARGVELKTESEQAQ